MRRPSKLFYQLSVLLTILSLRCLIANATPTFRASQLSPPPNELSPTTQLLSNTPAVAPSIHLKRAPVTRGTFLSGLWAFALTTTTFLAQAPSSSVNPASEIEYFAQKILDRVATRIASGAAEKNACGWALDGVSITFASWLDPRTNIAPGVPWAVVQEFVLRIVLWRAQHGMVAAFSGYLWGPGGQCIQIVLDFAGPTGAAAAASSILDSASSISDSASSILDSASEIHGNG